MYLWSTLRYLGLRSRYLGAGLSRYSYIRLLWFLGRPFAWYRIVSTIRTISIIGSIISIIIIIVISIIIRLIIMSMG